VETQIIIVAKVALTLSVDAFNIQMNLHTEMRVSATPMKCSGLDTIVKQVKSHMLLQ